MALNNKSSCLRLISRMDLSGLLRSCDADLRFSFNIFMSLRPTTWYSRSVIRDWRARYPSFPLRVRVERDISWLTSFRSCAILMRRRLKMKSIFGLEELKSFKSLRVFIGEFKIAGAKDIYIVVNYSGWCDVGFARGRILVAVERKTNVKKPRGEFMDDFDRRYTHEVNCR